MPTRQSGGPGSLREKSALGRMRGVRLPSLIEPVSAGYDQQWSYRPDEVSHSLGHSHNGQVQVCPHCIGHYRCIDDPQTVDAVHLAVLVNNCHRII